MRRTFILLLVAAFVVFLMGVVVFRVSLDLSWIDSVYFVITTMTTVGYGDVSLLNATAPVKLLGNILMLAGAGSMAALFGLITDYLLHARLEQFFGGRRWRMHDHVILCGLGNVGIRVLEHLRRLGEDIVVIEKKDESRFLDMARAMKVPIVKGDMRVPASLEQANVKSAKALIAAVNDDIANLEAVLNAREIHPEIRVVLRIFDTNLAKKMESGFGIKTAFSTSALSAPGFAMAAVDPDVVGSFYVSGELMTNVETVVAQGSALDGMTTEQLRQRGNVSILSHACAKTGQRHWHPSVPITFAAGDRIVVSTTQAFYRDFKALNEV